MQYINKYIHAIYNCLLTLLIKNPRIKKMGNRLKKTCMLSSMKTKVWLDYYDNFFVVLVHTVDQNDLFFSRLVT